MTMAHNSSSPASQRARRRGARLARLIKYEPLDSYGFWRRLTIGRTELSLRLDHPGFHLIIERLTFAGPVLNVEFERPGSGMR